MDPQRVLIIDDDKSALVTLRIALSQRGFEVTAVTDPQTALAALAKGRYAWMVTDAKMEPVDGFTLSRKASEVSPSTRIVMVSAVCSDADIARYPIAKCFCKPYDPDALAAYMKSPAA